jgi:hypothetical protein
MRIKPRISEMKPYKTTVFLVSGCVLNATLSGNMDFLPDPGSVGHIVTSSVSNSASALGQILTVPPNMVTGEEIPAVPPNLTTFIVRS